MAKRHKISVDPKFDQLSEFGAHDVGHTAHYASDSAEEEELLPLEDEESLGDSEAEDEETAVSTKSAGSASAWGKKKERLLWRGY